MIRIQRPKEAPRILDKRGSPETQTNCELYDEDSDAYRAGTKSFSKRFKGDIYAHESVREKLMEAQCEKCCYCESRFHADTPPEIEHFRPKSAVRQKAATGREYPGYYWLAYSWDNLLMCCRECNLKKSDFFPLVNESKRARNHHDELDVEDPLFVDPGNEDPRDHIDFFGSTVRGRTPRGRRTIQTMELDRSGLEELRRDRLAQIRNALLVIKLAENEGPRIFKSLGIEEARKWIEEARRLLEKATLPEARYCAMARDFLTSRGVTFGAGRV